MDEGNASALRGMGIFRCEQDDSDGALAVLGRSIGCSPGHPMGHYHTGEAYYRQGNLDSALAAWIEAGALPRLLDVGDEQVVRQDFGAAQEIFTAILGLGLSPRRRGAVFYRLGRTFALDGDRERARECFSRAAEADESVYVHHAWLGRTNMMLGYWGEAERAFARALELRPGDSDALYDMGEVALRQDRIDRAILFFRAAVEQDSTHAFAHARLGRCFLRQGDAARARDEYLEAVAVDSRKPSFHHDLARVYERLGERYLAEQERAIAGSLRSAGQ